MCAIVYITFTVFKKYFMPENEEIDFDSPEFETALAEARERAAGGRSEIVDENDEVIVETSEIPASPNTPETPETPAPAKPEGGSPADTAPNIYEFLATQSEGSIKDEAGLKSVLEKIKGYDSLEVKLRDTELKIPKFKNPETEALFNLWASGEKKAVLDYIKESEKDYKTMSDVDVVREALAKKNPNWSPKDIDVEMRVEYGKQLEPIDLANIEKTDEDGAITDEYKEALAINERVEENLLRLQRAARDSRLTLIDEQSKIELPTITKAEAPAAPAQLTAAEIAERTAAWVKSVEDNLPKLSNIKMTIDNKEVEYVTSDDEKKELTDKIKNFNIFTFGKTRGWYNEDGSTNPLKLAEDVQKMEDFEKITASLAGQVKTETTKGVLRRIKNTDGSYTDIQPPQAFDNLEDAVEEAKIKAGWKKKAVA